jgi:hypothetical protein
MTATCPRSTRAAAAALGSISLALLSTSTLSASPVYFVVAEKPGNVVYGDSFVVGLDVADHIAHARELIQTGPDTAGSPILFADIAAGANDINRDVREPGAPRWNWHVTRVEGFGDFGIELLDGWPSFVESVVDGWIRNTSPSQDPASPDYGTGRIGFWNYTVVAELPKNYPDELPPVVPLPAFLPMSGGVLMLLVTLNGRVRRRILG